MDVRAPPVHREVQLCLKLPQQAKISTMHIDFPFEDRMPRTAHAQQPAETCRRAWKPLTLGRLWGDGGPVLEALEGLRHLEARLVMMLDARRQSCGGGNCGRSPKP